MLKLISVLLFFISISLFSVESRCSRGCDLALASYYVWQGANLTFISEVLNSSIVPFSTLNFDPILIYNRQVPNKDSVQAFSRLNVPFPCDCINGDFLGHVFTFSVRPGDTYDKIASEYYSGLTTVDWLQRFNSYPPTNIPDSGVVNVVVNCSCGDPIISRDYGLFITYPLRQNETLNTVLTQTNLSSDLSSLVQSYNPGVNFSSGAGLVYIPGRDADNSFRPLKSSTRGLSGGVIAGVSIAAIVVALLLAFGIYARFFRKRKGTTLLSTVSQDLPAEAVASSPGLTGITVDKSVEFSYEELAQATDNFSLANKIGEGGFGAVYYANLRGEEVAIKKMDMQASKEFLAELKVLTHVHHLNLVRLIGYCVEGSLFLVYEFIENGNLSQHLRGQSREPLPWSNRVQIALDSARGLEYIHEHTVPVYIHRDIKPANILIDKKFRAKVADFGLTKLTEVGSASIPTRLVGTFGYMPPENFISCVNEFAIGGTSDQGHTRILCWGVNGHFKRDCRAPKKNTGTQESANVTQETGDAMILSVNSSIESWILDSGASFHSTPCQEIMENYVNGDFGKVHLADDETLKIVGKEDIRLKLPNQTTWKLTGVRHIPDLKRNLISVGQLDGEGYSTTFSVADADGKSNLWHQRLGHMSEKGMKILLSKGKLPDLKNVDVGLCEDCIFGKQKKVSFAKIGKTLKAERLELVHTDVWVPSPVTSLACSLYYVTFIDDSTRKYRDSRFRDFCANNGIKIKTTVPIIPQQNGVAERMNRTLNERARSMRIHAGLPKFLWAEAINTAAYLINRGPSVPLDGGIPEEAWSKKEINLSHLRVFGCISYVHIDSAERSKIDAKSNKCAFVGYGGDEFGYRFWDYENRKIIRSRDVIFNENINPEAVQEEPRTPELRRSSRIPKPTQRYSPSLHYLLLTDIGEPECYDEAMQVEDSVKWESSMKDEMDSLMSNQTWELAELPPGKRALHNKWIYRIKEEHDGSKHYKARLVVKGFQQKEDVKTTFLHGDLEEEIYMRQPEGFIEAGKKNLVCRLKKSLYGLKQAPRQWYKKFDSFMGSSGFTRCQADHCCYIKRFDNSFIILLLYVDDMLVAGSDMQEIINLKQKLSKQFAIKDLGAAKQILGMRIKRDTKSGTLMLSQAEYINKVLSRFNMQDAKPVSTPLGVHFRLSKDHQSPKTEEERAHMVKVTYASAIGSLMYDMVCTRPDIAHAVGVVSRYMNNPGKVHWEAVKWILRYMRGTTDKALCFKGGDTILTGYVDADLARNVDIRRSTTWYVYTLGGIAVSWVSQLQKIVALSTTEAEYVAVTEASKEMVWLQSFLEELGKKQENNILYCDSQSAIHLAKNPSFHSRTKHIQLRYHFIRSLLEDEILKLEKISGAQNPADMLTKTVTTDKLKYAQYGDVSPKVDVYAFGVVLYELISAKEAIVKANGSLAESKGLVALFEDALDEPDPKEAFRKLVDERLGDNYPLDAVFKMAQLAKACTHENPQLRPSMRSIVVALMTLSSSTEDWDVGSFYENQALVNLMAGR
ncbi:Chitin elicitor receptor kinase 1 [Hibiscus syriacus]|uniref:Chitin elicitor receptor kinase 1 n=1 Tax=Hibiscus syriacus TaxID=106335 RepID=A0A6A2YYJ9_HIBSY|nr:Chitin elicitor receptor kinase 1 [Hibiscus syriacus]